MNHNPSRRLSQRGAVGAIARESRRFRGAWLRQHGPRLRKLTWIGPLGPLVLLAGAGPEGALEAILFPNEGAAAAPELRPIAEADAGALRQARDELAAYFAGALRVFATPLAPSGTPFQRAVWRRVSAVPYGATTSYAAIAEAIGRPRAARAVGGANGRNPIPIIIPCHRILGSHRGLRGYGGGLALKADLLRLEGASR